MTLLLALALLALGPACRTTALVEDVGDDAGSSSTDDGGDDDDDDADDEADDDADDDDGSDAATTDSHESGADTSTGEIVGTCPAGVAMSDFSGKAIVEVSIDGTGPYDFIVDTGAPVTVVDPVVTDIVGTSALSFDVAGETFDAPSVESLAVSASFPGVSGILGMNLIGDRVIHFDYPRGRFWLADAIDEPDLVACAHLEGDAVSMPLQSYGGYLYVTGRVEAQEGWLLVDSGASLGAITESTWAQLQAAAPRPAMQGFYTEAFIGTFWAELGALGSIDVGDRSVTAIFTRTIPDDQLPQPADDGTPLLGLLPSGHLHHFLVTVDIGGGTLRLDRAANDDASESPTFFPLGLATQTSTTTPVHVGQVLAGSAAEDAGVEIGDEIVAVGGSSFSSIPAGSRAWALGSASEGDATTVTLRRAGQTFDVVLDARDLLTPP